MYRNLSSTFRRIRSGGHISCLAAAAGAAAVSAMPLPAKAAIVYSGLQNLSTKPGARVEANVDQAGELEFFLQPIPGKLIITPGGWVNPHWQPSPQQPPPSYYVPGVTSSAMNVRLSSSGRLDFLMATPPANTSSPVALLGADTFIGGGGVFSSAGQSSFLLSTVVLSPYASLSSGLLPGTEGVIGFRFNPSGEQFVYGWARLRIKNDPLAIVGGTLATLVDWAYDDTGEPIRAGQMPVPVPEPGTAACLTAACLAGAGRRRR